MSRVLVTGGAGMIGQAITRRLLADGNAEVRVSDQRPAPDWMAHSVDVHVGDLRDAAIAREATAGVTEVIHCAAIVGGIANFHRLPYTLTAMNSALYDALIGASLREGVGRFVYISSSMVFERARLFPTPEDHLPECLPPRSAYGFSKLAGEVWCRAAHAEHGLPFTICRPFNAYGPGETPTDEPGIAHVVPDLIRKMLSGQRPLQIFGSGGQTRTLTHVDDIADGVVTALRSQAALGEDFNISADEELTVEQIARIVWEQCGEEPAAFELEHVPSFPVDVQRRWPSVEKARRMLGWTARIGVEEGIASTVAWLREGAVRAMSPTALITGITGQDGSYLADVLLEKGYDVHGLVRRSSTEHFERIEHIRGRLTLHQGDLLDQRSLVDALRESRPDEIYNLAAMSYVAASWVQPTLTAEFTGVGVTRILEAVREVCPEARFYQASSSEMFGKVREVPQTETTPFYPRSPYGVAKAYGHFITINYRESYGLHATSGILFNHESPRRGLEFVTRKITWHAAAISLGLVGELRLGNLDSERDWGYARDYVEAMWLMLQRDEPEDFVIATGRHPLGARLPRGRVRSGRNLGRRPRRDRRVAAAPAEVDHLIGDYSKARELLGWTPSTDFEHLIRMMVDADRKLLSG